MAHRVSLSLAIINSKWAIPVDRDNQQDAMRWLAQLPAQPEMRKKNN